MDEKEIFRCQCLNEWKATTRCNDCMWLNITEEMQRHVPISNRTIYNVHACMYYGDNLFHETNYDICPCKKCEDAEFKMYRNRKEQSLTNEEIGKRLKRYNMID